MSVKPGNSLHIHYLYSCMVAAPKLINSIFFKQIIVDTKEKILKNDLYILQYLHPFFLGGGSNDTR